MSYLQGVPGSVGSPGTKGDRVSFHPLVHKCDGIIPTKGSSAAGRNTFLI